MIQQDDERAKRRKFITSKFLFVTRYIGIELFDASPAMPLTSCKRRDWRTRRELVGHSAQEGTLWIFGVIVSRVGRSKQKSTRLNMGGQGMTNIIKFPRGDASMGVPAQVPAKPDQVFNARVRVLIAGSWCFVWGVFVLLWPITARVFSLEVFFQLLRMLYYWNTPDTYAAWTFLLHFSVLTALTCMVAFYKPKGF